MAFVDLPNEIILQIAEEQEPSDINALVRTNRRLAFCLTPTLWASIFRSPPQLYAVEALLSAAENENKDVVKRLLDKGILQYSQTPLWKILRKAITERGAKTLRTLIECGTPIDATDPDGWTLLGLAAEKGCLETFLLLVAQGFDINEPGSPRCESPLGIAARGEHDEVVQVLLTFPGIDLNP
ncbi:ankyrin repeat-containing domain protein [Tuber indicum]|nr:ankyrin repeat-containing domain protein [Tuber indicum]